MNLNYFKDVWGIVNRIHPETRSVIIIILFGWILYSQITGETGQQIKERFEQEVVSNKKAEQYSMETGIEINQQVQEIAEIDKDAFDVLLLNYHNNTQSLQGYKYLYLSCLTEAPRSLDTPTLQKQWNRLDYIYYADELAKLHRQSFVPFSNIEQMGAQLPKLYRLVKASDAESITFFNNSSSYEEFFPIFRSQLCYQIMKKHRNDYNHYRYSSLEKYFGKMFS